MTKMGSLEGVVTWVKLGLPEEEGARLFEKYTADTEEVSGHPLQASRE